MIYRILRARYEGSGFPAGRAGWAMGPPELPLTVEGSYQPADGRERRYIVEITQPGTPDVARFRFFDGTWQAERALLPAPVALSHGLAVRFPEATFQGGERWEFGAYLPEGAERAGEPGPQSARTEGSAEIRVTAEEGPVEGIIVQGSAVGLQMTAPFVQDLTGEDWIPWQGSAQEFRLSVVQGEVRGFYLVAAILRPDSPIIARYQREGLWDLRWKGRSPEEVMAMREVLRSLWRERRPVALVVGGRAVVGYVEMPLELRIAEEKPYRRSGEVRVRLWEP